MLDLDLNGKRALVCGSSQGIGKSCAEALAGLGAEVVLFARNSESLEAVRKGLPAEHDQRHAVLCADFGSPDEVRDAMSRCIDETGPLHILVNNTGGPPPGPAHAAAAADYLAAFSLHLVSNQNILECALPGMRAGGYGRIINIISTSVKTPLNGLGVSNTVRGAVASWAKSLANELGPDGITVNNVLPGSTRTGRLDGLLASKAKKENVDLSVIIEREQGIIPLRRFGEPEEIANAVAFLASPAAAYITGTNITVDGGRTACL